MLQWRNWHTRQIQTLFSPGSTPGWSTIFEINSGGDFVNNISAVAIGMLIAAHREGDEEKFRAYVELIAETYEHFSAHASAAPETRPAIVAIHQPERRRHRKRSCRH